MARSFWSKRKESIQNPGGYVKATNAVSKPMALLLTVVGILVVGGLLFGTFAGTRWAITQLTSDEPETVATSTDIDAEPTAAPTNTQDPQATTPPTTVTSSTTTTTPSPAATPTPAPRPVAQTALPNTGPTLNYTIVFLLVSAVSYALYRKKSLKA